ncbi:MAG: hypothetical protein ACOH18_04555 [Candidatus Saccharimonadaceae bacterium]
MHSSQIRKRRLPTPVIGAFDAHSASDFAALKAANFTHVLIEYRWDEAQPNGPLTPLDATVVTTITTRVAQARAAGLRVQFQVAFHYVPSWVDAAGTTIPKFKNQLGTEWSETNSGGRNIRDWYFTAVGRQYLADFIQRCFATLDLAQIDSVRTGIGWYGENNFPPSPDLTTFHWWGYSDAAQTGSGLAPGMSVCPVPAYVPFSGNAGKDTQFTDWYLDAAAQTLQWLITVHRSAGWKRDLFILQPGFGIRSTMPYGSDDYKRQACIASDWDRQIAVYGTMSNVFIQCTWIDGIHPYGSDLSLTSNQAAWYRLQEIGKTVNKGKRMSGENTATDWNYLDEDRIFQLDALVQGYRDMWFLTYPSLAAATNGVVNLAHTTANIAYLRDSTSPLPTLLKPTAVTSPLLYLSASSGVIATGGAITQWNDQSSNGNNTITASGTARPTLVSSGGPNGLPYVSFNGTANVLTFPSAPFDLAAYTVFVVARTYGAGGFMGKIGGTSGNSLRKFELGMSSGGQFYTRAGSDSEYSEYYTGSSLFGGWHVYSATMRAGDDFDMNVDGANQTRNMADGTLSSAFHPTPFNSELLALGREGIGGGFSHIDIAEVLMLPSALDVATRQRVETYFRLAYKLF